MPSKKPVPAAQRQRKLRAGVRTELRTISARLDELPGTIKAIVATALAEQRQDQQQEHK